MVLVGVSETQSSAFDFMDAFAIERRCIVDNDRLLYDSYEPEGDDNGLVVPLHVVVDRDGVVRHYSKESDFLAIQDAIEGALVEGD